MLVDRFRHVLGGRALQAATLLTVTVVVAGCGSGETALPVDTSTSVSEAGTVSPGEPANLRMTAGDTDVTAVWEPPGPDSPAPDAYRVWFDTNDAVDLPATELQYAVTGLLPGSWHQVRVAAVSGELQGLAALVEITLERPASAQAQEPASASGTTGTGAQGGAATRPAAEEEAARPAAEEEAARPAAEEEAARPAAEEEAARPAAGEEAARPLEFSGSFTTTWVLSGNLAPFPTDCSGPQRSYQVTLMNGAGEKLTLSLPSGGRMTKHTIDEDGTLVMTCEFVYDMAVETTDQVLTVSVASRSGEGEVDERTVSRDELTAGTGPSLYIGFCPSC